eukprot:1294257-Pleurochrysis_carterae.AAC.2
MRADGRGVAGANVCFGTSACLCTPRLFLACVRVPCGSHCASGGDTAEALQAALEGLVAGLRVATVTRRQRFLPLCCFWPAQPPPCSLAADVASSARFLTRTALVSQLP